MATHDGKSVFLTLITREGDNTIEFKLATQGAACAFYRSITEYHEFYRCETVRNAVKSQFTRDLKETFFSLFNEEESDKKYIFDVERTCTEVYDHYRRVLYKQEHEWNLMTNTVRDAIQVPIEIRTGGPEAKEAYHNALLKGRVQVYRGRIMLIGQDRAGKTSLKKSLLGLPFDPGEPSTNGIEVDPSTFEVEVDQVKNWHLVSHLKLMSEYVADDIARIMHRQLSQPKRVSDSEIIQEFDIKAEDPLGNERSNNYAQKEHNDMQSDDVEPCGVQIEIDEATAVPEDVVKQLTQYLRNREIPESSGKRETLVSIWDFAGQHVYYASHAVFFSARAVYVLVYNLSKDLNAMAKPYVRQGVHDVLLENAENRTNLEEILSWLVSVHNIQAESNDQEQKGIQDIYTTESPRVVKGGSGAAACKEGPASRRTQDSEGIIPKGLPYLRPPVIIVGTNADHPFENPKNMETQIKTSLLGKSYQQHVVKPFLVVNNTLSSEDKGVQSLQQKINEVFQTEPYMGETVPVQWFTFEKVVEALVKEKKIRHLPLNELERIISEVCFVEDSRAMLNFYHDLGVIVQHGDTVVLQAQWLIEVLRKIITIRPFDEQNPRFSGYWTELEESGVLHMDLAEHVFSEFTGSGQSLKDILAMMEHYGLIAKFSTDADSNGVRYFVPAQLSSSPEDLVDTVPSSKDPCALYVRFPDGFVPHGLYSMFISRLISWCSKEGFGREPNLYRNASRFILGKAVDYDLVLICGKCFIKIVLRSFRSQDSARQPVMRQAASIRCFVEQTLYDMSRECAWLRNMRYELCVICPSCLECPKPCKRHRKRSCDDDDCMHFLPISAERVLICAKSYGERSRPNVLGLEDWYRETENEKVDGSAATNEGALAQGTIDRGKRAATAQSTFDRGNRAAKYGGLAATCNQKVTSAQAVDDVISWREGEPTDGTLHGLAEHLIDEWKDLATKLGVHRKDVKKIVRIYDIQEHAIEMLILWRDSGPNRTYKVLGKALLSLEKYKLARQFCGRN